jgi:hypothetical protein
MDPRLRKLLGPAYPLLMRAKGARPVQQAMAMPGAWSYHAARRASPHRIGVDLTIPMGFGAIIAHALLLHAYFEAQGVEGHIRATSPLYSQDGEDVLARFFERAQAWPQDLPVMAQPAADYLIRCVRPEHAPLETARRLYARHFQPNALLRAAIDEAAQGQARFDLSIHYRGTDKFLESGFVESDGLVERVRQQLAGIAQPSIFLATDDARFAARIRQDMPHARFASYDLGQVEEGVARHFSNLSPREKALEALVNIHLIARAPVCVRTSSFLSSVSALVNPALRTITINRTLGNDTPFPEFELLQFEAASAPAPHEVQL